MAGLLHPHLIYKKYLQIVIFEVNNNKKTLNEKTLRNNFCE